MPVTVAAIGSVQAIVSATVRAQLAGTLFQIEFSEGQTVEEGQLLAKIERIECACLAGAEGAAYW